LAGKSEAPTQKALLHLTEEKNARIDLVFAKTKPAVERFGFRVAFNNCY
jgi:hypothetical protein